MTQIKKIFVPTDYSPCSQAAVSYAAFLAGRLKAVVLLAHIFEPSGYPLDSAMAYWSEFDLKKMSRALERVAHTFRQNGIPVETRIFHGDPVAQIVRQAEQLDSDLIVMGTHGRTGMSHLMIGSVAEQVVRASKIPVLTVQEDKEKVAEEPPREEQTAEGRTAEHERPSFEEINRTSPVGSLERKASWRRYPLGDIRVLS